MSDDQAAADRRYLRALGKRIRLLRVDHEMSQEQLAVAAGMSRNFISSLERGAHGVDIRRLVRVAAAFNVDIADIVAGSAPVPDPRPTT